MSEYIRLPKFQKIPDSTIKAEKLNDEFWKNLIFHHLLKFYKETDFTNLKLIIAQEKLKKRSNIEDVIKKYIRNHFNNDQNFGIQGFILNREPSAEGKLNGFYDLKFQHSNWRENITSKSKYFAFECKNLDSGTTLVNEYVYCKKTSKDKEIYYDGGVFRHFNSKYVLEQNFGGMIGFILSGNTDEVATKIKEKLKVPFHISPKGNLIPDGIIHNSIESNENTFDSIHLRNDEEFRLHHLLFNFN